MTGLSRSAVGARLADLDPAALTAFVAAVYDARGWETAVSDGGVRATPPGEDEPRRLVVAADLGGPGGADAVDAVDAVDADDLYELLAYAVDADDRAALCRRFLDCDPAELTDDGRDGSGAVRTGREPAASTAGRERGGDGRVSGGPTAAAPGSGGDAAELTDDADDGRRRRVLVAGLVALLVVVGVVAAVGSPPVGSDEAAVGDAGGNTTATATATATATTTATATRTPVETTVVPRPEVRMGGGLPPAPGVVRVREGYPPGVDAGGVTNASALAAAHRTALTNGSYRLSVEYREYVGGRPTGRVHEQTLVENATRYRSTVTTVGAFRGDAWAAANATTYADGERAYTRLTNETYADGTVILTESATEAESAGGDGWRSVAVTADRDRFASRTAGYLLWLLDDGDSTVVGSFERDGRTWVWIGVQPGSAAGTDAVGSVLVDERGLVRGIHYEYTYLPADSSSVRAVVSMEMTPTNASVVEPAWVRRGGE